MLLCGFGSLIALLVGVLWLITLCWFVDLVGLITRALFDCLVWVALCSSYFLVFIVLSGVLVVLMVICLVSCFWIGYCGCWLVGVCFG